MAEKPPGTPSTSPPPQAAGPRRLPGLDANGTLMPHARWQAGRVCSRCGSRIVRGPVEVCQSGHWEEVPGQDVPPPPETTQPPEVQRNLAVGYVLRWVLGIFGAFLLVVVLLLLVPLVAFGLVHVAVAVPLALVLLVTLIAAVVSPPALHPPFERFVRAEANPPPVA